MLRGARRVKAGYVVEGALLHHERIKDLGQPGASLAGHTTADLAAIGQRVAVWLSDQQRAQPGCGVGFVSESAHDKGAGGANRELQPVR